MRISTLRRAAALLTGVMLLTLMLFGWPIALVGGLVLVLLLDRADTYCTTPSEASAETAPIKAGQTTRRLVAHDHAQTYRRQFRKSFCCFARFVRKLGKHQRFYDLCSQPDTYRVPQHHFYAYRARDRPMQPITPFLEL